MRSNVLQMPAHQDVLAQADAQADEMLLAAVQERQDEMESLVTGIAAMLYKARALHIGGLCLPWGLLGKMRQQRYRMEVKRYIQEME